jgi:hypothetical protein
MSDAATPKPRTLEPASQTPKVYPATGELALKCVVCTGDVSARQNVMFWPGVGVVAHIHCAFEAKLGGAS